MNTTQTYETESTSSAQTEALGEKLARNLRGGEVIELASDLGGGKTTFVRGLARGLGSENHVSSPTFKISNIYKTSRGKLHHFDFYRLPEPGIVADELAEVITEPHAIVVVEWGDIVNDVLPAEHIKIEIRNQGETTRKFIFSYPSHMAYVFE